MDVLRFCFADVKNLRSFLDECGFTICEEESRKLSPDFLDNHFVACFRRNNCGGSGTTPLGTGTIASSSSGRTAVQNLRKEGKTNDNIREIYDFASNQAALRSNVWTGEELRRGWWKSFLGIFGTQTLLHLWTQSSIFRKHGKTVIQLTGKSLSSISVRKRKLENEIGRSKRPKLPASVSETLMDAENVFDRKAKQRHRKKSKRRKNETKTFASSILESWPSKRIPAAKDIFWPTKFIYAYDLREHWGRDCLFHHLKPDREGAQALLNKIFGSFPIPAVHPSSLILYQAAQEFIRNFHRTNLSPLLKLYFPLPENYKDLPIADLVNFWIQPRFLKKFFRKLWTKLFPESLLGAENKEKLLMHSAERLIEIRRRDCLGLHEILKGMKVTDCMWIKALGDSRIQEKAMRCLLAWTFKIMIKSIRDCFYVTESQMYRNRLLYYRKPLWHLLVNKSNREFREKVGLKCVKSADIRSMANSNIVFGPHAMKYVPKNGGVRGIVTDPSSNNGKKKNEMMRLNWKLQHVKAVLCAVGRNEEKVFGSVKRGTKEIHDSWKYFVNENRKNARGGAFMVKADMHACFDQMKHDKLYEVLRNSCPNFQDFGMQKFNSLRLSGRKFLMKKPRWEAWPLASVKFAPRKSCNIQSDRKEVLVPLDSVSFMSWPEVVSGIDQLTRNHFLKLGQKFYLQTQGIPTGLSLSVLLCNIYLGALETDYWPELLQEHSSEWILMRHVDDFLLVTKDEEMARNFLMAVCKGFEDYAVCAKPNKTVTNFEIPGMYEGKSQEDLQQQTIPWCGYIFDPSTLEVRPDTERWHTGCARDVVKVRFHSNAGEYIERSMKNVLKSRMQPMCLDRSINYRRTIEVSKAKIWNELKTLFGCLMKEMEQRNGLKVSREEFATRVEAKLKKLFEHTAARYA